MSEDRDGDRDGDRDRHGNRDRDRDGDRNRDRTWERRPDNPHPHHLDKRHTADIIHTFQQLQVSHSMMTTTIMKIEILMTNMLI